MVPMTVVAMVMVKYKNNGSDTDYEDSDDDLNDNNLIFLQESPVTSKRRVHFLDFMLDVHGRMHKCRQRGISGEVMVSTVTDEILQEGWLLCFDEMQVFATRYSQNRRFMVESKIRGPGEFHNCRGFHCSSTR